MKLLITSDFFSQAIMMKLFQCYYKNSKQWCFTESFFMKSHIMERFNDATRINLIDHFPCVWSSTLQRDQELPQPAKGPTANNFIWMHIDLMSSPFIWWTINKFTNEFHLSSYSFHSKRYRQHTNRYLIKKVSAIQNAILKKYRWYCIADTVSWYLTTLWIADNPEWSRVLKTHGLWLWVILLLHHWLV